MSSFVAIGEIFALYGRVQRSLEKRRRTTSGRNIGSLEKDLAGQEYIFKECLQVLIPVRSETRTSWHEETRPNSIRSFSQGSFVEPSPPYAISLNEEAKQSSASGAFTAFLRGSTPSNAVPWRDLGSEASVETLFSPEKVQEILTIFGEMQLCLHAIEQDSINDDATLESRRGWFGTTFPPTRNARRNPNMVDSSSIPTKVDQLHRLNIRLRRLPEPNTTPSEPASTPVLLAQSSISRHEIDAGDVYHAIRKGFRCECQHAHLTKFGVPQIGALSRSADRSTRHPTSPCTAFSLLFSTLDNISSENLEDSLSLVASTESIRALPATSSHSLSLSDSTATLTTPESSGRRSSRMKSSVSSNTTMNSFNSRSSRAKSCAVVISESTSEGPIVIKDLCDAVKTVSEEISPRSANTLGILRSKKRKRYILRTLKPPATAPSQEIVSLEDYFASNQSGFSRKVRIGLALRLSHAVIRFYSTPWITDLWSWRDFSMTRAERSQDDCQLFVGHAFYSTGQAREEGDSEKRPPLPFAYTLTGEPRLTKLGLALIELAFGKRLAELRTEDERQITEDEDTRDLRTAMRILDSGLIRDEENEQYENIVKVCLKHQFKSKEMHRRYLSSDEPSFQADAEQLIVAPLLEAWTREWPSSVAQSVY